MSHWQLATPVAFIVFNRPQTTRRVFARIAQARPPVLLVVADGPRDARAGEAELCREVRAVIAAVDWECQVLTNYSDVNLGCKNRVASGLDWVFEQVPEAIILEDDCLPDPTFFRFCEEMLIRYRDDTRVAMVSGDNFQTGRPPCPSSYYFSRFLHIWGWASWRRAWKHYDRNASIWPQLRDADGLKTLLEIPSQRKYWKAVFQSVYDGQIDTWDYQWTLAAWSQGMLAINPAVNLVSNIGFGAGATHTTAHTNRYANLETKPMSFPMTHPSLVLPDHDADSYTGRTMFSSPGARDLVPRVAAKLKRMVR